MTTFDPRAASRYQAEATTYNAAVKANKAKSDARYNADVKWIGYTVAAVAFVSFVVGFI